MRYWIFAFPVGLLLALSSAACDGGNLTETSDAGVDTIDTVEDSLPSDTQSPAVDADATSPDIRSDVDEDVSEDPPDPHPDLPEPPVTTSLGAKEHRVAPLPDSSVVNVTDSPYNAPTDGHNDALDAIQTAIDDHSGSGATIYLPHGDYKISDQIHIEAEDTPITLKGAGSKSRILVDGEGYGGIEVGDYQSGTQTTGATIRDLFVHKTGGASDNANGIQVATTGPGGNHTEVRNVWVAGFTGNVSEGIRIGANGDSVVKYATVSGSGAHGLALPNYGPGQLTITSVVAFDNGFHSGNGYGIDADGAVITDAVSVANGQGAKTSPDSEAPETIWRNVWLLNNQGVGYQITESAPNGVVLDGVYAERNDSWGFRLTDKVDTHFRGDIRAAANGQSGETGNILIRAGNLDFDRFETCDAASGPGAWAAGSAGGTIDVYVHSGNRDGALTGAADNLDISQMQEGGCDVPSLP